MQSTIDPYKCDNVRLVQECNELHLDLMKERDNHQKQNKDFKKDIYKLEHECSDLQLASSRNLHRIKELETESAKKSKRILELQGKCLKPTISNVGLGKSFVLLMYLTLVGRINDSQNIKCLLPQVKSTFLPHLLISYYHFVIYFETKIFVQWDEFFTYSFYCSSI